MSDRKRFCAVLLAAALPCALWAMARTPEERAKLEAERTAFRTELSSAVGALRADPAFAYVDLEELYLDPEAHANEPVSTVGVGTFYLSKRGRLEFAVSLMSGFGVGARVPVSLKDLSPDQRALLEGIKNESKAQPPRTVPRVFSARGYLRELPGRSSLAQGFGHYLDGVSLELLAEKPANVIMLFDGGPIVSGPEDCVRHVRSTAAALGTRSGYFRTPLEDIVRAPERHVDRRVAAAGVLDFLNVAGYRRDFHLSTRFGGMHLKVKMPSLTKEQRLELLRLKFPPSAVLVHGTVRQTNPFAPPPAPKPATETASAKLEGTKAVYLEADSYRVLCEGNAPF